MSRGVNPSGSKYAVEVSKRAAVYVRVSTQEQSEKGWSIDGQIEECERFCESKGIQVVEVFRDEGLSGSKLDRPGLLASLDYAETKAFDILVLWRFDRLSRNDVDFLSMLRLLDKMDIEVDSVTEPLPSQGPYGQFMMGMLGLMANLERNVLRMRVMMGMKARARAGLYRGCTPPYGYDYDQGTGQLVPNPREADGVRHAFDNYIEIESVGMVIRRMEEAGHSPKHSRKWHRSTMWRILRNRVYLGEYRYRDIVTKNPEIAIISEKTFENVQRVMEKRHRYAPRDKREDIDVVEDAEYYVRKWAPQKVDMPDCPYCQDRILVSKGGRHHSNRYHKVQDYYCRKCRKFFADPKRFERDTSTPPCPECGNYRGVSRAGWFRPARGEPYRRWKCECGRNFQFRPDRDGRMRG
jgi:DNA invertase Pin-like site-specific DNA recombinase